MNMKMEQYWPQEKVFIFGLAVLFPESLIGRVMNGRDLTVFFSDQHEDYFSSEQIGDSVKVTGISSLQQSKFLTELKEYLENYKHSNLISASSHLPKPFIYQQDKLIRVARERYAEYGYHQTVSLTDIWGTQNKRTVTQATFWELLLAEDLTESSIDILHLGYSGTYKDANGHDSPLPFVEFRVNLVTGGQFRDAIHRPTNVVAVPTNAEALIFMPERTVYLLLGNKRYPISRNLGKNSRLLLFMRYLLQPENDFLITIDEIKKYTGNKTINNLTELARDCGFDEELKEIFFPIREADKLRFNALVQLDIEQMESLKRHLERIVSKS